MACHDQCRGTVLRWFPVAFVRFVVDQPKPICLHVTAENFTTLKEKEEVDL